MHVCTCISFCCEGSNLPALVAAMLGAMGWIEETGDSSVDVDMTQCISKQSTKWRLSIEHPYLNCPRYRSQPSSSLHLSRQNRYVFKVNLFRPLARSFRTMSSARPEWLSMLEKQIKENPKFVCTSRSLLAIRQYTHLQLTPYPLCPPRVNPRSVLSSTEEVSAAKQRGSARFDRSHAKRSFAHYHRYPNAKAESFGT